MCHMVPGWGTRAGKAVVALSATVAFFVLTATAFGAGPDPPPVPKPDPPPKAKPAPPPPASRPAPVAPQPAATQPAVPQIVAPAVVRPTAAERQAAAARRSAKARAARAALAARRRERAAKLSAPVAAADSPSASAAPYLIVAFGAALLLLGLALTPATALPWHRASRILEDRREEFAVLGAMGLIATVFFFLLGQMTT